MAKKVILSPDARQSLGTVPINFEVPSGKWIALIGPNGSGKTTLLRAILGERMVRSGDLFLQGLSSTPVHRLTVSQISRLVAFVPQEHFYPSEISVENFLRFAFLGSVGLLGKLPPKDSSKITNMLKHLGLTALGFRPMRQLSTGERQRVFLARALLQNSAMLLLDEPTNHLDPGGIKKFWKALLEISPDNALISTHDVEFVRKHCHWVIALKMGDLFFCGPKEEYFCSDVNDELFDIS